MPSVRPPPTANLPPGRAVIRPRSPGATTVPCQPCPPRALTSSGNFYGGDTTKSLLLLSDGAYLEDQARAKNLAGDQWGMMNEVGNAPGQPWMWLYTFWYQVPPFSKSGNADALVWGLMMVLTLLLMFVPFIPGLRSIPRWIPLHRLIWRDYYRNAKHS